MNKNTLCRIFVVSIIFLVSLSPLTILDAKAQEIGIWISKAPLNKEVTFPKVAVVNRKIYAISKSATAEYDIETNTWTTKTPMPTARSDFGITTYKNKIYVIGGESGYDPDSTGRILTGVNEVYDPQTDLWETKESMPTPRFYIEANTVKNKIYLIAGSTNSDNPDVNEVYFPETDTWTTKAPMPNPVYGYTSAILDNKIYFFEGGTSESDFNQIYDTETDSWSLGKNLPSKTRGTSAGATTGTFAPKRIYVLGGSQGFAVPMNLNRIYDPFTDEWSSGTPMLTSRYEVAVAVVDDLLYAIGGGSGLSPIYVDELYVPVGHEFSDDPSLFETPLPPPTPLPTESHTPTLTPTPIPFSIPTTIIIATIIILSALGILAYFKKYKRRS